MQLRSRLEPERGILIAESPKVIDRALAAGLEPISLLMTETLRAKATAELQSRFKQDRAPIYVMPDELLEQLTGFQLTRGMLAAFKRPRIPSATELLTGEPSAEERIAGDACPHPRMHTPHPPQRIAILEDITNHTNVGAIFRNAAGLGLDAVLVTPGCYDPFYRRAVRVSMGTVFQVPWGRIGTDVEGKSAHGNVARAGGWTRTGIPLLHAAGFKVAAMALTDDSIAMDDPILQTEEKLALVLGTEGEGLSAATIAAADHVVRIPMSNGVDSLNVAAASAIAFWQMRRP